MRVLEHAATHDAALGAQLGPGGVLRTPAQICSTVRALKLVTVELTTTVTSRSADQNWRGDVAAAVQAPVKLSYGTDLSGLTEGGVSVSPLVNSCVIRVPAPSRIATEVLGQSETTKVDVGWGRFRSMAGEYYLGIARRDLYEQARAMSLPPADSQRVRDLTREQVAKLARSMLGEQMAVRVVFDDEPGWTIIPAALGLTGKPGRAEGSAGAGEGGSR